MLVEEIWGEQVTELVPESELIPAWQLIVLEVVKKWDKGIITYTSWPVYSIFWFLKVMVILVA
jgi:hypothetical protein